MADVTSLYDPALLAEAEEGFQEFSARFAALAGEPEPAVDSIVRFLRQIPAEDMAKKRELAKFFRTESGQRYSPDERKAAYDNLLGVAANRRTHG